MARGRRATATGEDGAANDSAPAPAPAPLARRRNARGVAGPTSALTSFLRVRRPLEHVNDNPSSDQLTHYPSRNTGFNRRDPWITAILPEPQMGKRSRRVLLDQLMLLDIRALASMTMEEHTLIGTPSRVPLSQDWERRFTTMTV